MKIEFIGFNEPMEKKLSENIASQFKAWADEINLGHKIQCPLCKMDTRVSHFEWCAITCPNCKKDVDIKDWIKEGKNGS